MDGALTRVLASDARQHIGALVTSECTAPVRIGSIELQPHQRTAVRRIEAALREFGGALLADETGMGKTYVALSIAASAARPVVVAPAALHDMWCRSAASAHLDIPFVSMEALSRRRAPPVAAPDLVIVDEAHHARNPATARYRGLAALASGARVLLLSATPVHNAERDLTTLLALFLGGRAATLDPAWTSRCIIRRSPADAPSARLPRVEQTRTIRIEHDERHLDAILALPPPVPPFGGGDGGVLLVYSLLRQWASSQGALIAALRRRLARAAVLQAALEAGRHPSESELAAWSFAEGTVQLAFPEIVVADAHRVASGVDLSQCVSVHADAVRALLRDLGERTDPDVQRAAQVIALRTEHPGARIVVFSQYAESVSSIHRLLRTEPRVAALTAEGGSVAGGTLTRAETLARFAPCAQGVARAGTAHDIDLLLTTDLLSEGVNLQDASVVVHLDLPWTPARLEQRVGRIARLGSAHECVHVYTILPPASTERIMRVEQRLRAKLGVASRTVGAIGTILPTLSMSEGTAQGGATRDTSCGNESPARTREAILSLLAGWRTSLGPPPARLGCTLDRASPADRLPGRSEDRRHVKMPPMVAAVHAPTPGFVALVGDGGGPRLLADLGAGATESPPVVLAALRAAGGADSDVDDRALKEALCAIVHWRSANRIRRDLSVDGAIRARARRSVVDRIAVITRRTPRHLRPTITALAATARRTAITRYGAGAERVLGELASAAMPDEAWLRAISTFGALHGAGGAADREPDYPLLALILLAAPERDREPLPQPTGVAEDGTET